MNHDKNVFVDVDLSGPAIDLLRRGVFPDWWAFVPVSGKATYVKEWASKPLVND